MDELVRDVHVERYYPSVLAPAKEFKAIANAENPELNLVWRRVWQLFLNTFVYNIDEVGAKRWESMLKLRPKATDTLEQRRQRILVKINSMLPYTYRRMLQILNALCGEGLYDVDLKYNQYLLNILVNPDITNNINQIGKTLRPIIPANLALYVAMGIYQTWVIDHAPKSVQVVNARHVYWNLGDLQRAYWDGEFTLDASIRLNAIRPDSNYRESQQHTAEFQLCVDAKQTNCQPNNLLDGSFCLDGSHIWQGETQKSAISNACTIGGEYV